MHCLPVCPCRLSGFRLCLCTRWGGLWRGQAGDVCRGWGLKGGRSGRAQSIGVHRWAQLAVPKCPQHHVAFCAQHPSPHSVPPWHPGTLGWLQNDAGISVPCAWSS